MVKPYERKINYYETDKMGIVHHSNFVRYMEETRLYYMEKQGIPYESVEKQGLLIPVIGIEVKYKKAIHFGDTIVIQQWIKKMSSIKFSVFYEMREKETGILYATAHSEHCFVDENLKPVRFKKEYPDLYETFALAALEDKAELEKNRE